MRIVIDIPEQDYELACKYPGVLFGSYGRAIAKGTPLPKGHGALIDRKELEEKIWDVDCRCGYVQVVDMDDILDTNIVIPEDKESKE